MTLLELNINLDRVADALERIAFVLERATELPPEAVPDPSLSQLTQNGKAQKSADYQEWMNYGPARRHNYGDST